MLLRLVPPAPLPTILFTLSFPTLPQSLPLPTAWENHLQLLGHYQLGAPPSLHALDKSVAWTALLDTVTFDLVSLTVSCVFVDGVQEEWPLTNRCVDLLESVIRDVNRSASEAEAEHELERPNADGDCGNTSSSGSDTSLSCAAPESEQPAPTKVQKPKKRRSILASLMATLVSSSSLPGFISPSRASSPQSPSPPPPLPPMVIEDSEPLITNGIPASRFLRRRARSTLVDAYRRFVVSELGARFQIEEPAPCKTIGGSMKWHGANTGVCQTPRYALWATRSTMRRVADEMARVLDFALYTSQARGRNTHVDQPIERNMDDLKDDDKDGDDSGSASSITDGSSVHTPLDSHDIPFPYTQSSSSSLSKHRVLPAPSPTVMTPEAYHAYVSLKEMHHRLNGLACQLSAEAAAQEQSAMAEAGGAEVKSRRRAWSSRQYLARSGSLHSGSEKGTGGVLSGASMAFMGLAVPVRPSPLCRGWSAEDLEEDELRFGDRRWCVEWEKQMDHRREIMRRVGSLNGEQSQRGRCYFGMTRNSSEAEDVHGMCRSALNMNAEEGPFGLVYSTSPRYFETKHGAIDEEDHEVDEDEDNSKDEDTDGDDTLYEKRNQEEFILQPSEGSSALLPPWPDTQLKTPQPTINKARLPKDLRPGRSMPIALMTPKLHATAAVEIEDFPHVASESDPVGVVDI